MMSVQGGLAVMAPRAVTDPPAAVTEYVDSFASLVEGGQVAEVPEAKMAVKGDEARNAEIVDDTESADATPEGAEELAMPPMLEPAPTVPVFVGAVPLVTKAAALSDAPLSAEVDQTQTMVVTLPAPSGTVNEGLIHMDQAVSAVPVDRDGEAGNSELAGAVVSGDQGWTAVAATEFHGPIEGAGTATPGQGITASGRPAKDGPAIDGLAIDGLAIDGLAIDGPARHRAGDGSAQAVAVAGKFEDLGQPLPNGAAPATGAGAAPVPTGRADVPEIDGKRRIASGGIRIERAVARTLVAPNSPVEVPIIPQGHTEGEPTANVPQIDIPETARDAAVPKADPDTAASGPDRVGIEPKLAAPSASHFVERRTEMSFAAVLSHGAQASAAEAPPPPRPPLVQAALDRVFPLATVAGETVVRLNPHGLGMIEVVLQEGRNGVLDVALRVQNPLVLEAMRQDRDAVAQTFLAAQGGAAGSLSMDLFHSGAGQRGPGPEAPPARTPSGNAGQDDAPDDSRTDEPTSQIGRADHVNIVT